MPLTSAKRETPAQSGSLTRLRRSYEAAPARWTAGAFAVFCACYLAYYLRVIAARPMWSDEFYTLYISRLATSELWAALLTGADQHPPLFYLLMHGFIRLFGPNEIAIRLPAVLGFLLMVLCLYHFVSWRSTRVLGAVAMVAPFLTGATYYAQEGRGYGLALGFSSLALLCWQRLQGSPRRTLWLLMLGASLALLVSSHYYGLLFLFPLALGEIGRSIRNRAVDVAVWLAFAAPAIPLTLYLPFIGAAHSYGANFWAKPRLASAFQYYDVFVSRAAFPFAMLLVLVAVAGRLPRWLKLPSRKTGGLLGHEITVAGGILLLPLVAVILAQAVQGGFHFRYVLYPVIGFAILLAHAIHLLGDRAETVGAIAALSITVWCGGLAISRAAFPVPALKPEYHALENIRPDLPIVVSESSMLFNLSYYAPPAIANRIVYLADAASELRYLEHDTVDRGLLALRPWFPVRVEPYCAYVASRSAFIVFGYMDQNWNWLAGALTADAMDIRVRKVLDNRLVSLVTTRPAPATCGATPGPSAAVLRSSVSTLREGASTK